MTARIDFDEKGGDPRATVAGRLDGAAARELDELGRRCTGLTVDLGDLQAADPAAVGILRGLRDRGARLTGASPYIAMLLQGDAGSEGPSPATVSQKEDE